MCLNHNFNLSGYHSVMYSLILILMANIGLINMKGALNLNPSCVKTLSAVEAEPNRSNQHELNGVVQLKSILGLSRKSFDACFSIRGQDGYIVSSVTWYDARESNPTRSEHRLYFQTNEVMERAQEGSTLILGLDSSEDFWVELVI